MCLAVHVFILFSSACVHLVSWKIIKSCLNPQSFWFESIWTPEALQFDNNHARYHLHSSIQVVSHWSDSSYPKAFRAFIINIWFLVFNRFNWPLLLRPPGSESSKTISSLDRREDNHEAGGWTERFARERTISLSWTALNLIGMNNQTGQFRLVLSDLMLQPT